MRYVVRYGDLSIQIEQWNADGSLNQIIDMHINETRDGIQFPFRYRCITEYYG